MSQVKVGIASTDWSRSVFDSTGAPVSGGAGWVRLQQMRPHLGFESVTGLLTYHKIQGFGVADFRGKVHWDCDVIIMQRFMFKDLVRTLSENVRQKKRPIFINDLDDWYWGLEKTNAAYALTDPKANPEENIDHYKEILKLSDVITVSTPFLYNKMTSWLKHKNVRLVENCVTVSDFSVRRLNLKKPIVGWVGSTSHRSNDLEQLKGYFDSSWRFHHSGHLPGAPLFSDALGVSKGRVTVSPMVPAKDYARRSFCFDIGLAPLNDVAFNHAKSWIKAIEYAAAGVPFVASDAPEYRRLQETYGIGRIASNKKEWLSHLEELKDPSIRNKEAASQRDLVRALDVKTMVSSWRSVIEDSLS
jgi:glycosyltransferase involved in cell wall biosynthesis